MGNNPILFVQNAGHGKTPVPADALLKLVDDLEIHNSGSQQAAKVLAIVPVGVSIDIARADQTGQPRPLMQRKPTHNETLYIIELDGREISVTQSKIERGIDQARAAGIARTARAEPPPWTIVDDKILDANGRCVFTIDIDEQLEIWKLIVDAVNARHAGEDAPA